MYKAIASKIMQMVFIYLVTLVLKTEMPAYVNVLCMLMTLWPFMYIPMYLSYVPVLIGLRVEKNIRKIRSVIL